MDDVQAKILVVEDDDKLGREVRDTLVEEGFEVEWMQSGSEARYAVPDDYQLIVLDLMLPGRHGFDLLADWRESSDVPVVILTARTDTHDKVRGFELGGDDYLTKPFWPEELAARVHARLRRPTMQRDYDRAIGPLALDFDRRLLLLDGDEVELTRVEFDILVDLARRPGMAVPRRRLVDRALDAEREGGPRTLDVHISRIRKKLGAAASHLETVWGIGYRLVEEPDEGG
jgi:two-component system response regulator MtrA